MIGQRSRTMCLYLRKTKTSTIKIHSSWNYKKKFKCQVIV